MRLFFFVFLFSLLGGLFTSAYSQERQPVIAPWDIKQQNAGRQVFSEQMQAPVNSGYEAGDETFDRSEFPVRNGRAADGFETARPVYNLIGAQNNQSGPPKESRSALEKEYSERAHERLHQFGYDLFGVPDEEIRRQLERLAARHSLSPLDGKTRREPMGAVQDDFILSTGDQLEIMFTGQRNDRALYEINSKGQILIKDFPPIPAAGRSIAQIRLSINAAAQNLYNTEAYISLSSVRQIHALVIGHVKKPGRQTLTVFNNVLDALMAAGGVQKHGSLRQIKHIRGADVTVIDLYDLIMGKTIDYDITLRDGDRIIVPAVGPTLAVAGEVKRPGIYEINPGSELTLGDMLALGGDILSPGKNRFLKLSAGDDGQEYVEEIRKNSKGRFGDGAILLVSKGDAKRTGTVELKGHTRRAGLYSLDQHKRLSDLLSDEGVLGPDIYPLIGLIKRWDPDRLAHKIISYPLRSVLKGNFNLSLKDGDTITLFSNAQIRELFSEYDNAERPEAEKNVHPYAQKAGYYAGAHSGVSAFQSKDAAIDDEVIRAVLRERAAFVRGAVRNPGAYPVAEQVSLDGLLAVAGGLALEADTKNIEITGQSLSGNVKRESLDLSRIKAHEIMIKPGDAVRVNQKFKKIRDQSVLLLGEIKNPGRYDLLPGDRISDLILRAGGFTREAYPDGAIFSRRSERLTEEARFRDKAQQLKNAIAGALEADGDKVSAAKIAETRALAARLEEAQGVGRITVEADLATLKLYPELDMLLESGDRLYIPKRSLTVRVSGEVLSPASLQFRKDKTPLEYIREAGGFTYHADKERAFVLYPNGSAQPLQVSAWNHKAIFIPPGSTIVVPRDPKPFDFIESARDISQILSNLAITAIFIDDVRDDGD